MRVARATRKRRMMAVRSTRSKDQTTTMMGKVGMTATTTTAAATTAAPHSTAASNCSQGGNREQRDGNDGADRGREEMNNERTMTNQTTVGQQG